jgi:hypothetical protein
MAREKCEMCNVHSEKKQGIWIRDRGEDVVNFVADVTKT